ncbi:hypothetical protein F4678DRAFT_457079 [Xylaria arbuscula]|nr:hypothetical protein F4678DRAFT_457079 [Xylaria arbuscula]
MVYSVLFHVHRKPGTTPEEFKAYYENSHIPLNDHAGSISSILPSVLAGTEKNSDYDALVEFVFEDEAACQSFFAVAQQPENMKKIAADSERFLDLTRVAVSLLGDTNTTNRG